MRPKLLACALSWAPFLLAAPGAHAASFTMEQVLSYPFISETAAAEHRDRIAWVQDVRGVRNVWVADGPGFKPRQVTRYAADDGQEITQLRFSPDGARLLYVRGGDHDANWPDKAGLEPNPLGSTEKPEVAIWAASLSGGGAPAKVAEGDAPAISARGVLAYIKDGQVWTTKLDGGGKPQRLFFDRGKDGQLSWSPDGARLAFVSNRGDHAFIGVFTSADRPLTYVSPSTCRDGMPVWSPDSRQLAFVRVRGQGGAPEPMLVQTPFPWSIWTAEVDAGTSRQVWGSPHTLLGSYPETAGEANLHWAAGDRLTFLADLDNWPHLYSVPAAGGEPRLLTPGAYMVEHVVQSRDHRFLIYSANDGNAPGDGDRRHIFRVPVDQAAPTAITSGDTLEWSPVPADNSHVAFIGASAQRPPTIEVAAVDGGGRRLLDPGAVPAEFPAQKLVTPKPVSFQTADGVTVHGQLFQRDEAGAARPAVIFVHGGPPRQMLLGWHYMDYYSNAYAVNQYLADHGFVVLSVNYRLGIGYGHRFHHPDNAGPMGASEYQDVQAGAAFLQQTQGVDPARIGIWGGSYGGYLTGLALARNSDVFKAGVDLHGVHDWTREVAEALGDPNVRFEQGERAEAMALAWRSSPDADVAHWRSPVLLIQGDDDRNVAFQQTIDLANRLDKQGVPYRELVLPNEIHGFLRYGSWLRADQATADFLNEKLGAK